MPARRPLAVRFWEKVNKNGRVVREELGPCWEWTGALDASGYGSIGLGDRTVGRASRVSYEIHYGPLASAECALHRCDNPACVNPAHLFKGTQKDNALDREAKGRLVHHRGDAHWTRSKPERLARGDRAGLRVHPERAPMGERNRHAKLTEELVRSLRKEYAATKSEYAVLGKKYGVTAGTVGKIIRRDIWKHVEV